MTIWWSQPAYLSCSPCWFLSKQSPEQLQHSDDEENEDEEENDKSPEAVMRDCKEMLSRNDFIMEPGIFSQLKRFFKSGGLQEESVEILSENYTATAQMVNLLAEWLIMTGMEVKDVQALVEDHLKQMIIKHFDPK